MRNTWVLGTKGGSEVAPPVGDGELNCDWRLQPQSVSLSASASNGSLWVCVVMVILIDRKSGLSVD